MFTKILRLFLFTVITFLLCTKNANAENKPLPYDSTVCCHPDSLSFISANCPVFCVRWKVPSDSSCKSFHGFEVQWKLLGDSIWRKDKQVIYTSGTYITFCDTAAGCGYNVWRVRTLCNDSTYSDWINGSKFYMPCTCDITAPTIRLSISPNPTSDKVLINANYVAQGLMKVSIVNMSGKIVLEKMVTAQKNNQLQEEFFVSSWPRGIYFVSISSHGQVIAKKSFVKE